MSDGEQNRRGGSALYREGGARGRTGRLLHDCAVMLGCIGAASALCALLRPISQSDSHVPLIFVLAVLVVSRYTSGYLFGLLASILGVLGVNYAFTFPYFAFNFSMTGYPLTFICFLGVSVMTSALTSQVRQSERMRMEGEREKMRSNLLRAISHDLRTPLTSIIGALNAVSENDESLTSAERRALLSDARMDAEWLINMVENLLSITRMGGDGTPQIHKELQAAEEVIGEAVGRFRKQYSRPVVKIRIPDQLLMVPMDAMLIEQVIINLLVNAALHGRTASTAVLSLSRDGDFARFRIDDDGQGFPPEVLRCMAVGHPLPNRGDRSGDTVRTMGIGLSVCKTILAAHGGTLSAGNRPEGGASVTFTLPLDKEVLHGIEAQDPDC